MTFCSSNETVCENNTLCAQNADNDTICAFYFENTNTTSCNATQANETLCAELVANVTENACFVIEVNNTCNASIVAINVTSEIIVNTTMDVYYPLGDEMWFTISLLVADHPLNVMGSFIDVAVTITPDAGPAVTGYAPIAVHTTGSEFPYLGFELIHESFKYWNKLQG